MNTAANASGATTHPESGSRMHGRVLDYLTLDIGAAPENLRLARLVVAGLGTSAGATIDDLEDLRIATDEICSNLVGAAGPDHRLVMVARVHAGLGNATQTESALDENHTVCVHAWVDSAAEPPVLDDLTQLILGSVSDAFGFLAHCPSGEGIWCGTDGSDDSPRARFRLDFGQTPTIATGPGEPGWGTLNAWFTRTLGHGDHVGQSNSDRDAGR